MWPLTKRHSALRWSLATDCLFSSRTRPACSTSETSPIGFEDDRPNMTVAGFTQTWPHLAQPIVLISPTRSSSTKSCTTPVRLTPHRPSSSQPSSSISTTVGAMISPASIRGSLGGRPILMTPVGQRLRACSSWSQVICPVQKRHRLRSGGQPTISARRSTSPTRPRPTLCSNTWWMTALSPRRV